MLYMSNYKSQKHFVKKKSFLKNSGTEKRVDTRLQKVVSQNFRNISYLSLKLIDFAEKTESSTSDK